MALILKYYTCDNVKRNSLHHRQKPLVQFESQLISPGTVTQINISPTLIETSTEAIRTFEPEKRQCYSKSDNITFQYFHYDQGYEYGLSNCLLHQLILRTLANCNCYPKYFSFYYNSEGIVL